LGQWKAEPVETDDPGAIARLAAEHALREAHHGTFGPLFWFLVLPGPLGLVLYPLAMRAAQSWAHLAAGEEREFGWFAARAFHVIDWVPQRATAFAFAVVGNFEDALYCWRSQAAAWVRPEEGVVLASGAGALGVRLGDPIPVGPALADRPALGTGESAREDALASLEGLLWRALILWLIAYLLAAALRIA
ncbi:MAG: regulatory signaling modulator protein AmpE, partial [Burkholderiales bacterium]|nr:regulatory signaling modulator protein AmpE [Burkholderiales bacterium]